MAVESIPSDWSGGEVRTPQPSDGEDDVNSSNAVAAVAACPEGQHR